MAWSRVLIVAAGAVVVLASAGSACAQAQFEPLGTLGSFVRESRAWGVSANGQVVVGSSNSWLSGSEPEAFRKVGSAPMQALGVLNPDYFQSEALAVSADGNSVVGSSFADPTRLPRAFRWSVGGPMVDLGGFPPAAINSIAYGVSANGSVLVGTAKTLDTLGNNRDEAFRWTLASQAKQALGFLPGGTFSWAYGTSQDGAVVVGFSGSAAQTRAFIWRAPAGPMQALSGDTTDSSIASGVSGDGRVVFGQCFVGPGVAAFRWSAGEGFLVLGDLPTNPGPANANLLAGNLDGSVLVGYGTSATSGFDGEAVIWDFGGLRSVRDVLVERGVNMTGWTLQWATGVSADGQTIVGFGRNPQGKIEAWRAFLPRCPLDYNYDRFTNLDDLGDFITDFYVVPAIPGGLQPGAPQNADKFLGRGAPCPNAPDAPPPYSAGAYRANGYRAGYSLDGSADCPLSPDQPFPTLDNLGDYITAFYGQPCA
jgi:probable HAF family extracellular repeat protein